MKANTTHSPMTEALSFYDRDGETVTVQCQDVALTRLGDRLIECRLTFTVSHEQYRRIDRDALFNLTPEVRGTTFAGGFAPEGDIEIEADLNTDALGYVAELATPQAVAEFLVTQMRDDPVAPVLFTENWYGLYVKQAHGEIKTGYRTQWAGPAENLRSMQADEAGLPEPAATRPILWETVVAFFREGGWPLAFEAGETILHTRFQGENGEWDCHAQVREEFGQFVFYSIAPTEAPATRRVAVAEYLHRANFGLAFGNFEFDYDGGQVRFRTAVDVDNGPLTENLIRQVVYANLTLMDRYLPGLLAVSAGVAPKDAIAQIEE